MENVKLGPDHFRYTDSIGPDGLTIECCRYIVIGETEHCYYVVRDFQHQMPMIYGENGFKKYRKRILKYSSRRFCYPELKDAMNSYRVRKLRQAQHAELALERAKTGRAQAEALIAAQSFTTGEVVCEGGDYIKELAWGDC